MRAAMHDLLWGAAHVQKDAVTWKSPLRAAIVAGALPSIAVATGNPQLAVPLGLGAVFTGVADIGEEPGQRWRTLLWTTTWMSVTALIGGFAGDMGWFEPLVAAAVALACGFAGGAGRRAGIGGLLALVVFTIAAGRPDSPVEIIDWALLIALGGFVQSVVSIALPLVMQPQTVIRRWKEPAPPSLLGRLRDRLHPTDDFLQHGIRLAVAIGVASAIARIGDLPNEYWIPMTVAWVTRPDQHGTVSRVVERVLGTILGIGVGLLVIDLLNLSGIGLTVLFGLSSFVIMAFIWANYPIAVVGITLAVLSLFAVEGHIVAETIEMRLFATVLGGLLAVAAGLLVFVLPKRT